MYNGQNNTDISAGIRKINVDKTVTRVYNHGMDNANRTMNSGPVPNYFQDVRIRSVPSKLVRRLKSVLALRGQTLTEWFMLVAAESAKGSPRVVEAVREMKGKK